MNFLNLKNECDDNLMSWITTSINISGTFSINICETFNDMNSNIWNGENAIQREFLLPI